MGVNLSKGGTAQMPGIAKALVALGWRAAGGVGVGPDLDASALLLDRHGRVLSDRHFVFYNNLRSPDGSVEHSGDDRIGSDGGDCETIRVDLDNVPVRCTRIAFVASIHLGEVNGRNFGQVRDAYIRVVDEKSGVELVRYDLTDAAADYPAVIFGELFLREGSWFFRAVEKGDRGGLRGIITKFGVAVDE